MKTKEFLIKLVLEILTTEENHEYLSNHLLKMCDEDIIDYALIVLDKKICNEEILLNEYEHYLKRICESNLKYQSSFDLIDRMNWLKELGLNNTNINLKESHNQILEIFDELNLFFNKIGINYYHTGGILAYILTNTPLQRFHHDLDVFIKEDQLSFLANQTFNSHFNLNTEFGPRGDGNSRRIVKMYYKNDKSIPISVFLFERNEIGEIIVNDYFYNESSDLYISKTYSSSECALLSFDDNEHYHNNIPFFSITLEALYDCKKGNRIKDVYDCKVMESFIDKEKLYNLEKENDSFEIIELVNDLEIKNGMNKILKKVAR